MQNIPVPGHLPAEAVGLDRADSEYHDPDSHKCNVGSSILLALHAPNKDEDQASRSSHIPQVRFEGKSRKVLR